MDNKVAKCLKCSKKILGYIKDSFLICGCCFAFCELKCYENFLNEIYSHTCFLTEKEKPKFSCNNCKHNFSTEELFAIIVTIFDYYKIFEDEENNKTKEIFLNYIRGVLTNIFNLNCMYCKCSVNEGNSIKITVKPKKQKELYLIMGSRRIAHRVCNKCVNTKTNICSICSSYHCKVVN